MEDVSNNLSPLESPGGAAPQVPVPVSVPRPRKSGVLSGANLLLAGLFASALVGLYLLHLQAGPTQASAALKETEGKMDSFLKTLSDLKAKGGGKQVSSTIDTTRFEARPRQVPLATLRLNPFRYKPLELETSKQDGEPTANTGPATQPITPDAKVEEALARVRELKLQSVMSGRDEPVALISNNLVSVGQKLVGWTVTDIQPQQVTLKWRDKTFTLYLN